MLLQFETKKYLFFPGDQIPFYYLKTQIPLKFPTPLFEIFSLMSVWQCFDE